jgi:hypothetical protein
MEPRLSIELVPRELWGESIANRYPSQWRKLRVIAYARAGHQCEICGRTGSRRSASNPGGLEAHEIWAYDISEDGTSGVQRLVRLIALCPQCHACKHMGRSVTVLPPQVLADLVGHFLAVNGMTREQYQRATSEAMTKWEERNKLSGRKISRRS